MESDSTGCKTKESTAFIMLFQTQKGDFSIFKLRKFDEGNACEKKKPKTRLNVLWEASSGEST